VFIVRTAASSETGFKAKSDIDYISLPITTAPDPYRIVCNMTRRAFAQISRHTKGYISWKIKPMSITRVGSEAAGVMAAAA
jgi:hypothetical protein